MIRSREILIVSLYSPLKFSYYFSMYEYYVFSFLVCKYKILFICRLQLWDIYTKSATTPFKLNSLKIVRTPIFPSLFFTFSLIPPPQWSPCSLLPPPYHPFVFRLRYPFPQIGQETKIWPQTHQIGVTGGGA